MRIRYGAAVEATEATSGPRVERNGDHREPWLRLLAGRVADARLTLRSGGLGRRRRRAYLGRGAHDGVK